MKKRNFAKLLCVLLMPILLLSCSMVPLHQAPPDITEAETDPPIERKPLGKNIVCAGDDMTFGSMPTLFSYPILLQKYLGDDYTVTNCSGIHFGYIGKDQYITYKKTGEFLFGMSQNPDTVIILLGTYDIGRYGICFWDKNKDQFESAVRELVGLYQALETDPGIYLCSPPCRYDDPSYNSILKNEMIPILQKVAEDMGCVYLDLYTPTEGKPELYMDCFNLNLSTEGEVFLARTIRDYIIQDIPAEQTAAGADA